MLFHYHFWTPFVEETETFYTNHGFHVSQRIGKYDGEFQKFNPPLTWDDFREKNILFRIIELKKGNINITLGYGKKIMFDHIGFLVSQQIHNEVCENAKKMNWEISIGERRTFIHTPYGFRIELQVNPDAIETLGDMEAIEKLKLETKRSSLEKDLEALFCKPIHSILSTVGDTVTIKEAVLKGFSPTNAIDPNGVKIIGSETE
ncbi:hypothetical protein ACFDTO_37165 [Microbacteriaceae bacterium 4G12]